MLVKFLRWATERLWAPDILALAKQAMAAEKEAEHYAVLASRFDTEVKVLEELFREKQAKIGRLQEHYRQHSSPSYEDLRKERLIAKAADMVVLARTAPQRAVRMAKLRQVGVPSDGTVEGIPGDRPNAALEAPW